MVFPEAAVVPPVKSVSATKEPLAGPPALIRVPPPPAMGVELGVGVGPEERRPKIARLALVPTNAFPLAMATVLYFTYPLRPSRLAFWLLSYNSFPRLLAS